jgi:hypothetical protein
MEAEMLAGLLIMVGCRDKADDTGTAAADWAPDFACPGSEGCLTADGALHAGAGAATITPTCFESWEDLDSNGEWDDDNEAFFDCGCDRLCADDEGYPGPDEGEEDGTFQAAWLAGFHNGRPAIGVHDDLWARAIIFEQGETRIGIVVVDLVGWFYADVVATRTLAESAGLKLDYLLVASTHNHEGPDTMGLWGRTETSGGYDEDYAAAVRQASVDALTQAAADLREVGTFTVGSVDVSDWHETGTSILVRDSRDPVVIDEALGAALITDTAGETIATLVHFGNHPEAMADENVLITSDFPAPLRSGLEELYGGTAIYLNGTVGGLMTPLGVTVYDEDGKGWRDYTFERLDVMGRVMTDMAQQAIVTGQDATAPSIAAAAGIFRLPVDNWGFQGMFLSGIIGRETFDWDDSQIIEEGNIPTIETEMAWLRIGPLELLTVPGELFPEVAIGGYDGSHVGDPGNTVVDPDNKNPPDLSAAPEGPYLKERLAGSPSWIIGMGNDEVGYFVPPYDFQLDEINPWFDEPAGDHYEETNSLGPQTVPLLEEQAGRLIGWVDENLR